MTPPARLSGILAFSAALIALLLPATAAVCIDGSTVMISDEGSVDVYEISDGQLVLQQKLRFDENSYSENGGYKTDYGVSLAISGDTAAVGATGNAGSVFLYRKKDSGWELEQRLFPVKDDFLFGATVALGGDTLVVGSVESYAPNSVNSAVSIFVRKDRKWILQQTLTDEEYSPYAHFGYSVSIDGNRIAVGARDSRRPNREEEDSFHGHVDIFERTNGLWHKTHSLTEPRNHAFRFGNKVKLSGNRLFISSCGNHSSAFIYEFNSKEWKNIATIRAKDGRGYFGSSLDIHGHTVVIGDQFHGVLAAFHMSPDGEVSENGEIIDPGKQILDAAIQDDLIITTSSRIARTYKRKDGTWIPDTKIPVPAP